MENVQLINLLAGVPKKILGTNVTRKGFKVENLGGVDSVEVQTVAFGATPVTGSWKLSFLGVETTALDETTDAAALQNALRALPGLSAVDVTGSIAADFEVTFTGYVGDAPLLAVSENTLEDTNTDPVSITVTEDVAGGEPVTTVTVGIEPFDADVDEIRTVVFSADPTAGSFKFRYNGFTTSALAHGDSAGTIQTALRLLPGLEAVTVSGAVNPTGLEITFTGADFPVGKLEVVENTLTIPSVDDVQTITFSATPEKGAWKIAYERMLNGIKYTAVTPSLAFDISAANLQIALRQLLNDSTLTASGTFGAGFVITHKKNRGSQRIFVVTDNTLQLFTNEVQHIEFSGTPDFGTFKLKFGELETGELNFDDSAATIQTAVRLLSGFAAVTVTGAVISGSGAGEGLLITFAGLAQHFPLVEVTESTLRVNADAEVQLVEFDNVPESGSFKLQLEGYDPTAELAFDDADTDIQTALRTALESDDLTVTGDFTAGFEITFLGLNGNLPLIEVIENTLQVDPVYTEQTIEFSADPDSGFFTLEYDGEETDPIPFDFPGFASIAEAVQDALREIPGLEQVTVTGDFATDLVITFAGVLDDAEPLTEGQNTLELIAVPVTMTITETDTFVAAIPIETTVTETTEGVPFETTSTYVTPGVDGAAVTTTVAHTTPGTLVTEATAEIAVDTPAENVDFGFHAAVGETIDQSSSEIKQEVFASAGSDTTLRVTEVF